MKVFITTTDYDRIAHKLSQMGDYKPDGRIGDHEAVEVDPEDDAAIAALNASPVPRLVTVKALTSLIHPIVALPSRVPFPYAQRWSREPGCFLLKSALVWRELGLHDAWQQALAQALANEAGFLPGAGDRLGVMDRLHAYSYYMEALLAERSPLLSAAIPRTAHYLHSIAPEFARSDVYAQLLRVRLYADALGIAGLDRDAASEEAAAIATFQYSTSDSRFDGGYCFGRRDGELLPFVNPVSTGFCLQALDMWEQHQAGCLEPGLSDLI